MGREGAGGIECPVLVFPTGCFGSLSVLLQGSRGPPSLSSGPHLLLPTVCLMCQLQINSWGTQMPPHHPLFPRGPSLC